jgi:V/A-type H+-transporting ATPase subunit K
LGTGFTGMAAVGAWKKCFAQEKTAPFILIAFVGAPLSQTIYGFILMNSIFQTSQKFAAANVSTSFYIFLVLAGLFGGIGIGASAAMQGKAGAAAADALAETGKGFGNYIMVIGIIETVALFTMIFLIVTMGKIS